MEQLLDKKKALELLLETRDHYNSNNRSVDGYGECMYVCDSGTTEGCAIGRKLTEEEKKKVIYQKVNQWGVEELCNYLGGMPEHLTGLTIDFLSDVQTLHDTEWYWDEEGITYLGREYVEDVRREYEL